MSDIIDIPTNEGYLETPDPSPPASDDLSSNDFPSNISDLDSDDSDDDYDVSRLATSIQLTLGRSRMGRKHRSSAHAL